MGRTPSSGVRQRLAGLMLQRLLEVIHLQLQRLNPLLKLSLAAMPGFTQLLAATLHHLGVGESPGLHWFRHPTSIAPPWPGWPLQAQPATSQLCVDSAQMKSGGTNHRLTAGLGIGGVMLER